MAEGEIIYGVNNMSMYEAWCKKYVAQTFKVKCNFNFFRVIQIFCGIISKQNNIGLEEPYLWKLYFKIKKKSCNESLMQNFQDYG